MSAQINQLKTKINSTKTTKKITKAMELVSRSKMRLFQDKALSTKNFEKSILNLIEQTYDNKTKNVYTKKRKNGDYFFILFTSDKGLCGSMNVRLINTLIKSNTFKDIPDENKKLIIFGKKGLEFANSNNLHVHTYYKDLDDTLSTVQLIDIIDEILQIWESKIAKEIYMVVPEFINTMTYESELKKFLPATKITNINKSNYIDISQHSSKSDTLNTSAIEGNTADNEILLEDDQSLMLKNIIYEPNSKEFINNLYNKMIYSKFMSSFVNLKATEYSSRMIAMKNATDSAEDMIQDYTLSYNRARQASITQEIAEIVGANF